MTQGAMTKGSVLLFGGRSDERLVSVASAQNLASTYPFNELWFIHLTGEVSRTSLAELTAHQRPFEIPFQPKEKPFTSSLAGAVSILSDKVVFLGLHGTEGEDGTIQALFEKNRIAFTGCGSVSSHDCFDKTRGKEIVRRAGLRTPEGFEFKKSEASRMEARLREFIARHQKMVIKPTESGSSIGLEIVLDTEMIPACLERIASGPYDTFIVESFITGRELTVGVLQEPGHNRALPPSEVILNQGRSFDYKGKYLGHGTTEITPADLTKEETEKAGEFAVRAHEALGCFGYSRTDMILTATGPVFLETNTLPGMTRASFYPQQLVAAQLEMRTFIEDQIRLGLNRYN